MHRQSTAADLEVKAQAIKDYFDDREAKVAFTRELYKNGRSDEAMILCCVYIESFGTALYWPLSGARRCFAQVLIEHGGEPEFSLIHPRALVEGLRGLCANCAKIADLLNQKLSGLPSELRTIPDFLSLTRPGLSDDQASELESNIWYGTLAAIAYKRLRSAAVHCGAAPDYISFDQTSYKGGPAPELSFDLLYQGLSRVFAVCRKRSVESCRFFGHDFRQLGD